MIAVAATDVVVVVADVGAVVDVADGTALWTVWVVLVLWCKVYDHGDNVHYIGVRFGEPYRLQCGCHMVACRRKVCEPDSMDVCCWVRFGNLMAYMCILG